MSGIFLLLSMACVALAGLSDVDGLLSDGGAGVRRRRLPAQDAGAGSLLCCLCRVVAEGIRQKRGEGLAAAVPSLFFPGKSGILYYQSSSRRWHGICLWI